MSLARVVEPNVPDNLSVRASRLKIAMLAAFSAIFVVAGTWLVGRGDTVTAVIGVVGCLFGAVCGTYALYRFVWPGVAVLLDADGLVDRASAVSVGRIRWDEIESVRVYTFLGQTMIGIIPRDFEGFLSRVPKWRRTIIRANVGLGCAPINIPEVILPVPATALFKEMERYAGRTWLT